MEHGMNLNISFFFELSYFNMHYTLPQLLPLDLPRCKLQTEQASFVACHWVSFGESSNLTSDPTFGRKKTEDCTRDELLTMLSSNFKRVDCTVHTNKQGWGWLSTNTWNIISMLVVQGSFLNKEITDRWWRLRWQAVISGGDFFCRLQDLRRIKDVPDKSPYCMCLLGKLTITWLCGDDSGRQRIFGDGCRYFRCICRVGHF